MIKSEQFSSTSNVRRVVPIAPALPVLTHPNAFQSKTNIIPRKLIDTNALDLSSVKGRFAWEKIILGDTYVPVIFRGPIKYFCIKMLLKILADYPEDVIHRASDYQYRKPISVYIATPNEITLLNRINSQHCNWTFSSQPFTITDELVRVNDFLPFYQYLRTSCKSASISKSVSTSSFRSIAPQAQQAQQAAKSSSAFSPNIPNAHFTQLNGSTTATSTPKNTFSLPEPSIRENSSLFTRPSEQTSFTPGFLQLSKRDIPSQTLPQQIPQNPSTQQSLFSLQASQTRAPSSQFTSNSIKKVLLNKSSTKSVSMPASQPPPSSSSTSIGAINASAVQPIASSSTVITSHKPSTLSSENQLAQITRHSSSSSLSSSSSSMVKPSRLHSGWLQINKLYTPYVTSSISNHHLYKIPVSLLTFYDLLKISTSENNTNESNDSSFSSFEQTPITPQEIELINELCLKQNIKPFSVDTKLIDLLTFYKHCSTNTIFIKELPLNEPKSSICKDWATIVQISGGIYRLRNIATLHEQTVPFIGTSVLKNFIMSSQHLSSASIITPTQSELEFLQLILFFSNISINLQNAKLIDIESVKKEYTVDLILLFNDKFPLNVLNYQNQTEAPSTSQGQSIQSDSSAAVNTFAQSTPPPSPISPPTATVSNPVASIPQSQIILPTTDPSNRYQKQITFHGHSMTAYVCSGLESNTQRECISVRALCDALYPNSSILEKLEVRMLRLLRMKNIHRFRPQNQQLMNFTRLVDIKDIEKHWDYIENGMHSLLNNNEEVNLRKSSPVLPDKDLKASKSDSIENDIKIVEPEITTEVHQCEKRPLDSTEDDSNHIFKRTTSCKPASTDNNNDEPSKPLIIDLMETIDQIKENAFNEINEDKHMDDKNKTEEETSAPSPKVASSPKEQLVITKKPFQRRNERTSDESSSTIRKPTNPIKKKIKINRKRRTPGMRSHKKTIASWLQKYNIEDFCICLDFYNPMAKTKAH